MQQQQKLASKYETLHALLRHFDRAFSVTEADNIIFLPVSH